MINQHSAAAKTKAPIPGVLPPRQSLTEWQRRDQRLRQLDAQLNQPGEIRKDVEISLRFERANLLALLGHHLDARSDYLRVLVLDPTHRQNLLGLGQNMVVTSRFKAAEMVYTEAVKQFPDDIVFRVNLGSVLLERENPAGARVQYEAALRLNPDFPQAHGGMYYALSRLGEPEAAEPHQRKAFGTQNLIPTPFRGASPPIPVLLLVSSTGGNTPIEKLLDDRVFKTYVVVADFFDRRTPLPEHQFVVNGIGDVDVASNALDAAELLLARTSAPVLNLPSAIRVTGRTENARRLGILPGVVAPRTALFPHTVLAAPDGPETLQRRGFIFPLLLRAPGFHMGRHFIRVESPESLAASVAELPGKELLVIEYLDARGADGRTRKYRVMIVDGQLYPLHLAVSSRWKIHYFSADMSNQPENRAEDAAFLADMPAVLGPKAMAALESIRGSLGLDYGGIDFGLNSRGEVLLFEANSAMIVPQPDEDPIWDYRRPAVERIHSAVRQMFLNRSASPTKQSPLQPSSEASAGTIL